MTDPFIGSLIGIYFCIGMIIWTFLIIKLSYRFAKTVAAKRGRAIKEDSWWPVIIVPVCGIAAMILASVWPVLILRSIFMSKITNRDGVSNVRSRTTRTPVQAETGQ